MKNNVFVSIKNSIPAGRSTWTRGVKAYALDLLETLEDGITGGWIDREVLQSPPMLKKALLNGASDWAQYSAGGCALIYDKDIMDRLCTKTEKGMIQRHPDKYDLINIQARALFQAAELIRSACVSLDDVG